MNDTQKTSSRITILDVVDVFPNLLFGGALLALVFSLFLVKGDHDSGFVGVDGAPVEEFLSNDENKDDSRVGVCAQGAPCVLIGNDLVGLPVGSTDGPSVVIVPSVSF